MSKLLKPIELAVNAALRQDPDTCERLQAFEQRSIVVNIEDLHQFVHVCFHQQSIQLSHSDEENTDLLISGTAFSLLKLGQHPDNLFSADIHIHGDVQFAKQLRDVLDGFDFDWEQQLARITGDVIAQPLAHGLKKSFSWLQASAQSLQQTTAEYLREEARLLPDKSQIDDYMKAIDELRADCDRLEARIHRLDNKS
ncbi:ubiquinone biosynthesis accessory factor UbiJ [Methylophaga sp. OBS4]|uniref:ubiquinone biosynthesis accessory factor UbiJ n=1 Tax=Methylophaga sp. OBS4 TaxID=2991935 RepID=UPI00225B80C7|nr:SCP2 sterol-binding domain-containing protein [Methylophaga sp. OBS4]MCX4187412.1 SCP2 sterol-binding domain-containing protein [Methylophaga sp. OBS4]